jgi:hypothetical protein
VSRFDTQGTDVPDWILPKTCNLVAIGALSGHLPFHANTASSVAYKKVGLTHGKNDLTDQPLRVPSQEFFPILIPHP